MNMSESDFENSLRDLRPLEPSAELEASIAQQLSPARALLTVEGRLVAHDHSEPRSSSLTRWFPGFGWACAGAAAAVAILALRPAPHPLSPNAKAAALVPEPIFEPEGVTRELLTAEDRGLIYEDEQNPLRLVRYTTLERHVWTRPDTGARLEVEIPREDLILMPVAMQ